jgi:hypothetical protein
MFTFNIAEMQTLLQEFIFTFNCIPDQLLRTCEMAR